MCTFSCAYVEFLRFNFRAKIEVVHDVPKLPEVFNNVITFQIFHIFFFIIDINIGKLPIEKCSTERRRKIMIILFWI